MAIVIYMKDLVLKKFYNIVDILRISVYNKVNNITNDKMAYACVSLRVVDSGLPKWH